MLFNFYAISAFVNFLTSSFLGVFVILRNRTNKNNILFFILTAEIALWNLFYFFWQTITAGSENALLMCRILIFFAIFIPSSYFHFTLSITDNIKKFRLLLFLSYVVTFVLAFSDSVLYFLGDKLSWLYFIQKVEPILNFKFWPMATPMVSVYSILLAFAFLFSDYLLIKKYFSSSGIQRLQLRYIALGFIIATTSGSLNLLLWYKIPIPPVLHILVSVYVFLVAYAITRYKLMDIKVMAKNISLYFGLAFFFYIAFYTVAFLYKIFFDNIFAGEGFLLGLFIAPSFAILLYSVNKYLSNFINRYIFNSLYDYQQAINNASRELEKCHDLDKISSIVVSTIIKSLQPDSTALLSTGYDNLEKKYFKKIRKHGFLDQNTLPLEYEAFSQYFSKTQEILIREELDQKIENSDDRSYRIVLMRIKEQLKRYDILLCVPLMENDKLSGVIVLGPKSDRDSYTTDDFSLLETLKNQAQITIENAVLYKTLEEKNKYLQELLDVKDDFIRTANHQLNTPLSIMRNAYSMIKDGSLTTRKGMNYLGSGLERLSMVVDDFWNVFELEEMENLDLQKTDISDLISNIVKDKNGLIATSKKKLKIYVKKSDFKIPMVVCDAKKITHTFYNLLDNAIHYTPKGKIDISYELNDDFIKINIKDEGIGFSREDGQKITQKFFRSRGAVLSHPDGSGLGLYICQKIIKANKGDLTFFSDGEGKGATFSFTLPIYKS